jgi:hypothetical protein
MSGDDAKAEVLDDEIQGEIHDITEYIETLCEDEMDAFWQRIDKIDGSQVTRNEITKELLQSIEHIFTYTPKD